MNDQRDPGQPQVTVGRPAVADATRVHQMQTGGVGEREVLIGVTPEQVPGSRQLLRPDRLDRQRRHHVDHRQKLQGAGSIFSLPGDAA